ncbi:MAG: Loki-CTERM sorting domain-containing protein [Candidatus Thermoplasmatota archaeon]
MKLRSYGIISISMLILLGACFTAAASSISDGTGDVWHYTNTGTAWSWLGNVGNKPNIDIKEISYEVNGDKIMLKLEVVGSIQTSDKVGYWVYYNSTDSQYWMTYMNGTGVAVGMQGANYMNSTYAENVTISGDTLSVVLDVVGDTSNVELWGYAAEYITTAADETSEWWGDWAPNEKFTHAPTDGTDETDGTDGTDDTDETSDEDGEGSEAPGFELVVVLAAVSVAMIFLRKRR